MSHAWRDDLRPSGVLDTGRLRKPQALRNARHPAGAPCRPVHVGSASAKPVSPGCGVPSDQSHADPAFPIVGAPLRRSRPRMVAVRISAMEACHFSNYGCNFAAPETAIATKCAASILGSNRADPKPGGRDDKSRTGYDCRIDDHCRNDDPCKRLRTRLPAIAEMACPGSASSNVQATEDSSREAASANEISRPCRNETEIQSGSGKYGETSGGCKYGRTRNIGERRTRLTPQ